MAIVVPAPGRLKETAQALLALAGDAPEIVLTISNGTQFEVPDILADLFHEQQSADREAPKIPKRRGRTPRVTEGE